MVVTPLPNEAEPSAPEMDAVVVPLLFLIFSVPAWLLAPTVTVESNVPVVPATVLGVVAPTVPLNAPESNVPPVTVLPVNVSALGSESVGVVVPVTVISFAVPVIDVTADVRNAPALPTLTASAVATPVPTGSSPSTPALS